MHSGFVQKLPISSTLVLNVNCDVDGREMQLEANILDLARKFVGTTSLLIILFAVLKL